MNGSFWRRPHTELHFIAVYRVRVGRKDDSWVICFQLLFVGSVHFLKHLVFDRFFGTINGQIEAKHLILFHCSLFWLVLFVN